MISLDKKYQTRAGHDVRIYAVDGSGALPVHGAYKANGGGWAPQLWRSDGTRYDNNPVGLSDGFDLVEVKPKIARMYWLVHFRKGHMCSLIEKPQPVSGIFDCTAITGPHTVEFTEGEGL